MRIAKTFATCLLGLALSMGSAAGQQAPQQPSPDARAQIADLRTAFVSAYGEGNVAAVAGAYHPEATFAGTLQPFWIRGRGEIADLWERYFTAWPQRRLIFRDVQVQEYAPNVMVETGYLEMYMARPDTREQAATFIRYSITRVLVDRTWTIVNMNVARLPG
jgi:uncharacterized protein (TIGR02246 family)